MKHVAAYRLFTHLSGLEHIPAGGTNEQDIELGLPYLPIELFRSHAIISDEYEPKLQFCSSGTTGSVTSIHHVADESVYKASIRNGFESVYGSNEDWSIYALLPSYLEQGQSSLVYMVRSLMDLSRSPYGGFYKYDYKTLLDNLLSENSSRKKLLIGVSFALWEMAEQFPGTDLSNVIIMETGGMKGRRREIIRQELHAILKQAFNKDAIHSEYGMTELLSQAYSTGDGVYRCPHWMKVLVRDPYDPMTVSYSGKGALNIIDLANRNSCSFLATNDLGEVFDDGSFTINGRMDGSSLRGCNLMF